MSFIILSILYSTYYSERRVYIEMAVVVHLFQKDQFEIFFLTSTGNKLASPILRKDALALTFGFLYQSTMLVFVELSMLTHQRSGLDGAIEPIMGSQISWSQIELMMKYGTSFLFYAQQSFGRPIEPTSFPPMLYNTMSEI